MRQLIAMLLAGLAVGAQAQPVAPAPDHEWNPGAADCTAAAPPPLQVRRLDARTFVLRQNPCASFEANFLYLLVGDQRALLIDSGAVADPRSMPLAEQVVSLLSTHGSTRLPLLVAHTHSHGDHRDGDAQFARLANVEIVPPREDGVRSFYGFTHWPEGLAQLDLGGRIVDVLPAPGHNDNHVVFYDRQTGSLLTGDFLLPGRVTVADTDAFRASARRLAAFVRDRPVSRVLGGHVEMDKGGHLYPQGATHHPDERRLELAKSDVFALSSAMDEFNGFYSPHANFVITHPIHNLAAFAAGVLLVLGGLGWVIVRAIRRRRRARATGPD